MVARTIAVLAFLALVTGLALCWIARAMRRLGLAPPRQAARFRTGGVLIIVISAPVLAIAVIAASIP